MGLDTSHNAWHGAYSAFNTWRTEVARTAGLPPLMLMEGFYDEDNDFALLDHHFPKGDELSMSHLRRLRKQFPIKWSALKPSPLHILLSHSDCDGYINWADCKKIADKLAELIPLLPNEDVGGHIGNFRDKTQTFINGLLDAHGKKEKLIFR